MLQVEQLERQEHTDRQMFASVHAADIPDAGSYRHEFDGLLVADNAPQTAREALLRRLGG